MSERDDIERERIWAALLATADACAVEDNHYTAGRFSKIGSSSGRSGLLTFAERLRTSPDQLLLPETERDARYWRSEAARLAGSTGPTPPTWNDSDSKAESTDEWDSRIREAFPTRSGSHETYAVAMRMVGKRHSKRDLVALINWLLVEHELALARMRCGCLGVDCLIHGAAADVRLWTER